MKYLIAPLLLSIFFSNSVYAQTPCTDPDDPACPMQQTTGNTQVQSQTGSKSISGDDLCGKSSPCQFSDLKELGKRAFVLLAMIGSVVLVVGVAVTLTTSWFAYVRGDAGAIKRAGERAFNAFIGFIVFFAVIGLLLAILASFGAKPWVVQLLQLFSEGMVQHAYAQTTFSNPLSSNSLYDIIVSGAALILRFFVYPAVIAMWVWSGFQFVYAQGNPEGLRKARAWLWWAFIITIVTFSLQAFILAFRGTIESIVPGSAQTQTPQNASGSGTYQPAPGTAGAPCDGGGGSIGQIGLDGTCYVTKRGGADGTTSTNKTPGTPCDGGGGSIGQWGTDGVCYVTKR